MPMTTSQGTLDKRSDLRLDSARNLVSPSHAQREVLAPLRGEHLQSPREKLFGHAARDADARQARQIPAEREHVTQVHRKGVLSFGADRKGNGRRRGADDGVAFLERGVEVALDQRPDLLGLELSL